MHRRLRGGGSLCIYISVNFI